MSRIAAAFAVMLLVASAVWLLLSNPQVADPGVPTFSGGPLRRLEAAAPHVGNFELFYVNHENPFIPFNLRALEKIVYEPRPVRPVRPVPIPPTQANPIPPTRPPVVVQEPVRKPLALPKLNQTGPNAPVCIGLVAVNGRESLIVRMPGDSVGQTIDVGTKLGGWTLLGIEGGNLARFRDPEGAVQVYPIGEGDLAVAQPTTTAASAAPTAMPKLPPGVLPKLPGAQAGQSVAPQPIAPQPIAPQPGDNRRRPKPGGMNGPQPPPPELPPLIPMPKK